MPNRLPPLNALRAFEAAARHLSFKNAAAELSVTPTAISHQIKLLEESLDLALFRRLARALELTPEGEAMLPKVREGLECFATAVERTRTQVATNRLFVTSPPSFATRWLVPRLQRFTSAEPQVNLHMLSSLSTIDNDDAGAGPQVIDNPALREDDAQVSIRFGTGNYPGFRVDRIFGSDYVAVCSPALLKGMRPLRRPSDIKFHVLIHDDTIANERARPRWDEWVRLAGVSGVDTHLGPHFSDSGLALVAAADGVGLALASRHLVAPEIAAGKLACPFDIAVGQQYAYYLVVPEVVATRPSVETFRRWILKEAADEATLSTRH